MISMLLPAGADAAPRAELIDTLADWAARGWLRELDARFAGFLWRESPDASPLLILAAALASHQLGRGHVCLDLAATLAEPELALSLPPQDLELPADGAAVRPAQLLAGLDVQAWCAALTDKLLVARADSADVRPDTPLVLDGERLYLRRFWRYEQAVRTAIRQRLQTPVEVSDKALQQGLAALFPGSLGQGDWQQLACALAARSAFAVITGGPGTGKTTTVVRLLALLQSLALKAGKRPLRIRLAAPTGKAAARLSSSIGGNIDRLNLDGFEHPEATRAAIPREVGTLHRLLGSRPDSRRFRHHAGQPLPLDILVIDEASMIDLEMMAAVLDALPPQARLILLGDKDQLASVEAGAVLGSLCQRAQAGHYTPATADWLHRLTGSRIDDALLDPQGGALDQAVAMLRRSFRFGSETGIGRLAAAVNQGDGASALGYLQGGASGLRYLRLTGKDKEQAFAQLVLDGGESGGEPDPGMKPRRGYRHYLEQVRKGPPDGATEAQRDAWAGEVLDAQASFQLLCALRRGPWGVEGLNRRIAEVLHREGLIDTQEVWYAGRPVLVTRNDAQLGLMNGDIGVTLPVPDGQGVLLRVAFRAADGHTIRWVLPSRLQAVETVYALTVHKSQGSEFDHAALVLPDRPNPILTRELLYTGITRAREWLTLACAGEPALVEETCRRRVLRAGALWPRE